MTYDWLIVGAGFAGATMARLLAEAGERVLIIDKRDHIGGNAYDYVNEYGVRVQAYGVHAFHTNSEEIWAFLSRFTEWTKYEHRPRASVCGMLLPFPPNADTMAALPFRSLTGAWKEPQPIPAPANAEEQCLATVGEQVYDLFFKGYTEKQWGRPARELDASVTARVPFRPHSTDDRIFLDKHQAVPKDGYTAMFERMLDHPNIRVELRRRLAGPDAAFVAKDHMGIESIVWTGCIDEFFNNCFRSLPYRSLRFHHQTFEGDLRQPCAQINYPASWQPFTRTIEWRHITGEPGTHTTITTEFPTGEGEPYYPIPAPENRALYQRYRDLADEQKNILFLGRLATYQYLNMDQVVGQAMAAFRKLNR